MREKKDVIPWRPDTSLSLPLAPEHGLFHPDTSTLGMCGAGKTPCVPAPG